MTKYGRSIWRSSFPKSRQPNWPRLRGRLEVDVAIVGGGLTGCAIAQVLAAAGIRAALFEAGRVGQGATGASAGILSTTPAPSFVELDGLCGRRVARQVMEAYRYAALDFAAVLRRLGVRCNLAPQDAAWLAVDRQAERTLAREHRERVDAGLDAVWLKGPRIQREIGVAAAGVLATTGTLVFDPYRACVGLARAAASRGMAVFERSRLVRCKRARRGVELTFESGVVAASTVVLATGAPPPYVSKLARHFTPTTTYHVATPPIAAAARKAMGSRRLVLRDTAEPPHWLRWTDDHRVLFSGADQPSVPSRSRDRVIVQRTGQLMYELSLLYPVISGIQPDAGWDETVARTGDGLPCIGPHRAYPHHLFALGADPAGAASSMLAARLLLRHLQARPGKSDPAFGFGRH